MPWVEKPHKCKMPLWSVLWVPNGSIWECRRCGQYWKYDAVREEMRKWPG